VVLVWLNKVEVGSFTFTEAILSVKLKLSGNNWIFTPAVHVKCGFSKNEYTSIGKTVGTSASDSSANGYITDFSARSGWSGESGTSAKSITNLTTRDIN